MICPRQYTKRVAEPAFKPRLPDYTALPDAASLSSGRFKALSRQEMDLGMSLDSFTSPCVQLLV